MVFVNELEDFMANRKFQNGSPPSDLLFKSGAPGQDMPNWPRHLEADDRFGRYGPRVQLLRADQIDDADNEYLLPGTLLQGCPHILVGTPGVGKSTLLAAMAATISNTNLDMWTGKPGVKHGTVVIYNSEDFNSVLKMRLEGANANLANIRIIGNYRKLQGHKEESFSTKDHGEALKTQLQRIPDVVAIFFDNISGLLNGFSSANAGVREAFNYIKSIAPPNCAIVALTHFRKDYDGKNPLSNILGSGGISQVARAVLVAKKIEGQTAPDGSPLYALVREKVSNGKGPGGGTYYSIGELNLSHSRSTSGIFFHDDFCQLEEESAQSKNQAQFPKKQITLAIRFITSQLAAGPMPAKNLQKNASEQGISNRTLERAREILGIVTFKSGIDGKWWLGLPGTTRDEVNKTEAECAANAGACVWPGEMEP